MLPVRLVIGTMMAILMLAITAAIGVRFLRGGSPTPADRAVRRFGVWWVALGLDGIVNAATWLVGGLGLATAWTVAPLVCLALAAIATMLWGLMSHLAYLITGRPEALTVVTWFYIVQFALGLALVMTLGPNGVVLSGYGGEVAYANTPPAWAALAVAVFFLLPPLLGALAYGVLAFRAPDGKVRRRMWAIAAGITTWFTASILSTATDLSGDIAAFAGFGLAMACMLVILWAYRDGIPEPAPRYVEEARRMHAARAAFQERLRQML